MKKPELKNIPLDLLSKGKYQSREIFDEEYLEELALSIKENGLIQPIVVRPKGDGEFEIVAGERRWRAAQRACLDEIPCLVRTYSDEQAVAATTIENIQRRDLNPIEEAEAYHNFVEEFGYLHGLIVAKLRPASTKVQILYRKLSNNLIIFLLSFPNREL